MADEDNEFERPRKIPKTLKEKDSGKRLIVILENASLETVKVLQSLFHFQSLSLARRHLTKAKTHWSLLRKFQLYHKVFLPAGRASFRLGLGF